MDPSHNTFAILGQISPNSTSNPNTLPFLDQINTNTNTASPSSVIAPTPVFPNSQSAFTHYNAPSSAYKRTKKCYPSYCPKLATRAAMSRHSYLKHTVQCGSLVQFCANSDLLKVFQFVKLEPLVFFRYKFICHSLVQEFYCNLETCYGLNGEKFATSVLNGIPVLITHEVISRALGFNYEVSKQPIINITQAFVFNKNEFHLYLSTFCKSDIPVGKFDNDEAISYEHFAPEFQVLALIYRSNIFPKPNHDKLFSFLDVKIMFLMLTDKLNFNISYMILLNMINATHMSYMPYGLLLSCLFSHLKLDLSSFPTQKVSNLISKKTVRNQIPISEFVPTSETGLNIHRCMADHTLLVAKVEEFQKTIGTEIEEMRGMHMRAIYRVNHLMNVVNDLVSRAQMLEQNTENLFELIKKLNMFDDDDMVVPNLGNRCDSVFGRNDGGNDGMEEGEAAVEQQ